MRPVNMADMEAFGQYIFDEMLGQMSPEDLEAAREFLRASGVEPAMRAEPSTPPRPASAADLARRHRFEPIPDDDGDCCDRRCTTWMSEVLSFFDRHKMLTSALQGCLITSPVTLLGAVLWGVMPESRVAGIACTFSGVAIGAALAPLLFCCKHVWKPNAPPTGSGGYGGGYGTYA